MYDVIIIGAGASGLFAAASINRKINGLILNKSKTPGIKLLLSGGGQCNITNGGDIKSFLTHYGTNGGKIRKSLYQFSNRSLVSFLEREGLETVEREDGKIFPRSLESREALDLLIKKSEANGFSIRNNQGVTDIQQTDEGYAVTLEGGTVHECLHLVVATGGSSYPGTGSDGSIFPVCSRMGLEILPTKPALVPLFVENYCFSNLSGISFPDAAVSVNGHSLRGGLLLTHTNFSGPAILDASRYAVVGGTLSINYLPDVNPDQLLRDLKGIITGNPKQISTVVADYLSGLSHPLPKRFIDQICTSSGLDSTAKASSSSGSQLKNIGEKFCRDTYVISGTAGFNLAMATSGGVSLEEVDPTSFECKKYPRLYILGEALDVDGDTGGYNIQFAFTSGFLSAKAISSALA